MAGNLYKYGSSESKAGSLYYIKDDESKIMAFADIYKNALVANGITITLEVEQQILDLVRRQKADFNRRIETIGIPNKLKNIFTITKKSKVAAYCKTITVSREDMSLLLNNCSQIGLSCRSKYKLFIPSNYKICNLDLNVSKNGNSRNLSSKMRSIMQQRKKTHVHLFEKGNEWHCFYFDFHDLDNGRVFGEKSHFKYGSHLHYLSHLWPEFSKNQVWNSFDKRDVNLPSTHIKMEEVNPLIIEEQTVNLSYQ
jgi:hypothetical protein